MGSRTARAGALLAVIAAGLALSQPGLSSGARAKARSASPQVAIAADGVPVYGPRGPHGKLIRPSALDACLGHVSKVLYRGRKVRIYHYHRLQGSSRAPGCTPQVTITTSPEVFPKFDPQVSDYAVRCDGSALAVSVHGTGAEYVAIDGEQGLRGNFDRSVPLGYGQAFSFQIAIEGTTRDYHVRCLPPDFPAWNWRQLGEPSHDFYFVSPSSGGLPYVVLFNRDGVPLWWYRLTNAFPADAKIFSDGTYVWGRSDGTGYEIRAVDGTLLRTAAVPGSVTDTHDIQEAGNGNLMMLEYRPRYPVDLTAYGGPAQATILDAVVHEVDPGGNDVWTWSSAGHISLDETGHWWPTALAFPTIDPVHINSVDVTGSSVVISLRHTDAVYSIERATGQIEWKLGGTPTPQSLTVIGDPYGANPLGGQHDARILPDGTLTIHDNGTQQGRPPRAVRYSIDPIAHTATLIESVSDPEAPSAFCCGSARRSSDGSWTMSWGGNGYVTEFAPDGSRTFELDWGGPFSYRAFPVPSGWLSASDLRAGMSAMNPRQPTVFPETIAGPTGQRAAALKECKKKKGAARRKCKKKANKLPV